MKYISPQPQASTVDILIPTYNQSNYIEKCIESALNQNYLNIIIIIINDASTDKTHSVIKKYLIHSNIKYIKNPQNIGRVKNYQKALYQLSKSDYVINLDGDDWFLDKNYIKKAVRILDTHSEVACVTGNKINYIERESRFVRPTGYNQTLKPIMTGEEYLYEYATKKVAFSHLSTLYRRKLAINNNFYMNDMIYTDGESVFRLICGRKISFLQSTAGVWRVHNSNETKRLNTKELSFEDFFSFEKSIYLEHKKKYPKPTKITSINLYHKLRIKRIKPFLYKFLKKGDIGSLLETSIKLLLYDKKLFLLVVINIIHSFFKKQVVEN